MKCLILAAGLGTRLLPLTLCRAKSAVPYRNRPLIGHCLAALAAAGINDVAINLHHLPDSVRRAVAAAGPASVQVRYSYEPEILGTAGALNPLKEWLAGDAWLLLNGKIVFDFDLASAVEHHRQSGALATLLLVDRAAGNDFSPVHADRRGVVTGFGRGRGQDSPAGFVFTGIHIIGPGIWHYVPPSGFSDMVQDVYIPALDRGEFIGAYHPGGRWMEFSTLPRYLRLNVQAGGNVAGEGSRISSSARIAGSVVWDQVEIGDDCQLENCVVADGVRVPAGARLKDAAVVPAQLATPRFEPYIKGRLVIYPLESKN
ncbi:MAG: NDP-sugar synthase [Acidobacteria bacterium]|nr:NDP-sugar synthase [Acidobacteriota bacterium]